MRDLNYCPIHLPWQEKVLLTPWTLRGYRNICPSRLAEAPTSLSVYFCSYSSSQLRSSNTFQHKTFSHLYNAHILKSYHHAENYQLRNVYDLRLTLFPNWTSHLLLALLMHIFPPLICEKILLTMCISLIPLSLFYFWGSSRANAFSRTECVRFSGLYLCL